MDLNDVIKFAMANKVAYMATVDGNRPRVRAFDMWKADPSGFYFHNNRTDAVYKQLKINPRVDLIFPKSGMQGPLRIYGEVEFLDPATVAMFYSEHNEFKHAGGFPDAIFRMTHGEAWFRSEEGKRGMEKGYNNPVVKF